MSTVLNLAKKFNKQYNDENLALLANIVPNFKKLSIGNLGIDYPLRGGAPLGRVMEISGKYSSGKTTLACSFLKKYMDEFPDKTCVYVDLERSLDLNFQAEINGLDLGRLLYVAPSAMAAEDVTEMILEFQSQDDVGMIILDSLPALIVREVQEAPMSKDLGMRASVAKLLHRWLPQMVDLVASKNNIFCLINQTRESKLPNGAIQYTTPGGEAPRFYSSLRLRLGTRNWTLGEKVDLSDSKSEGCDGFRIKYLVIKNKTADSRFPNGFITYRYGKGIDYEFDNVEIALKTGLIERVNSSVYALKNLDTGEYYKDDEGNDLNLRGKPGVIRYLSENPEFAKDYVEMLLRHMTDKTNDNKKIDLLDEESIKEITDELDE